MAGPRKLENRMRISDYNMTPEEIRVLGCLMEKQRTTPDAYPLSLNALRLACNQSTNRDPVVEYEDQTIRMALHHLERRGLTRLASGAGSRAAKYRHLLAQALPLPDAEHAVLCVLMLRGPQTPGELKQRAERMHPFADLHEVQETLQGLMGRELVASIGRRPGQKEERYRQLLGAEPEGQGEGGDAAPAAPAAAQGWDGAHEAAPAALPGSSAAPSPVGASLAELAERVARLEAMVEELRGMRDPMAGDTA